MTDDPLPQPARSPVALAFVEAINSHEVERICNLMTEDHVFVDGMGTVYRGREIMREGWTTYFGMVPDYTIAIADVFEKGAVVALLGTAGGTYSTGGVLKPENRWEVPAAWRAVIHDGRISLWQVYADNEPLRQIIQRETGG